MRSVTRNPEQYIGKDILIEGKFNILMDTIVMDWFTDSGIIEIKYDGKAIDMQGNVAGNVMSGDYGYVAGKYGGEDEWGNRYIDAAIIILDNQKDESSQSTEAAGNGDIPQSENESFNPSEYENLISYCANSTRPAQGTKVCVYGWIKGHTGGTISFSPNQVISNVQVYYDSSIYTPVDGTKLTVYGTYVGDVDGAPCMDAIRFE